jgi:hypothetical protein
MSDKIDMSPEKMIVEHENDEKSLEEDAIKDIQVIDHNDKQNPLLCNMEKDLDSSSSIKR